MTRINPLPLRDDVFTLLNTEHLNGAWKETPRIVTRVEALIEKGKTPKDINIPEQFTFNAGHETFFYNKLYYIGMYYSLVCREGKRRNFDYSQQRVSDLDRRIRIINTVDPLWCNLWKPTQEDIYLGMARLVQNNFKTNMKVVGREIVE